MRLTLAAAALVVVSGAALAQGTAPSGTTVVPGSNTLGTPAVTAPAGNGGAQTPGATVNTSPQASTRSPSAVQTTNTAHRTGAAPVPGRNSFTMAQASRRITAAGYTGVTGLKKDGQGVWRGQAQKDGAATAVSLDYQGNVTAGQ